MEEPKQASSSMMASSRRLADTLLSIIRNRFELLGLELQEQKYHLVSTLIWIGVALVCSFLALVVVTFTIVEFSPEKARPYVLLGFCALYCGGTVWAGLVLRKKLRGYPPPLSDSVSELKKDIACLRSRD